MSVSPGQNKSEGDNEVAVSVNEMALRQGFTVLCEMA